MAMDAQYDGMDPAASQLSRRGKLIRVAVITGVVAAALVLILAETGGLRLPWQNSAVVSQVTGKAPLGLSAANWQQIDLPVSSSSINSYAVDPYNPGLIVFCTIDTSLAGAADSALVWISTNSGLSWTSSLVPYDEARSCAVTILTGNPSTVLVQAGSALDDLSACSRAQFYISADLGSSWHRILHRPIFPAGSQSSCSAWGSDQHLFMETTYLSGTGSLLTSLLERSDDAGKIWRRLALPALPSQSSLGIDIVHSSDDNILLADAYPVNPGNPQLWISRNAGSTWSLVGALPDPGATDLITPSSSRSNNQLLPSALYAVDGAQVPGFSSPLSLWMIASGHWTMVPTLPIPGALKNGNGLIDILGELPDGRLLALSADPDSSQSSDSNQNIAGYQQWLWIWNPMQKRWGSLPTPSTVTWPYNCAARCWQVQISVNTASNAGDRQSGEYLYLIRSGVISFEQHPVYRVLI